MMKSRLHANLGLPLAAALSSGLAAACQLNMSELSPGKEFLHGCVGRLSSEQ
jgi:hypothetical protein